jgi:hypothetical protein
MTAYSKIFLYIFLLGLGFSSCKNAKKDYVQHSTVYDCFELADFDTTAYPISDYFRKPYIEITNSAVTDSGCIYYARTEINLDSIAYHNIILYKTKNKIIAKLTDIKAKEFILFNFNYEINKPHNITINYCDSLTQSFKAVLDNKIIVEDNKTVYVYRIKDFYYWCHNGKDFTASMDVIFFITESQGIIGTYLEGKEIDGSLVMMAPAGNILSEYLDYSVHKRRVLQ